MKIWSKLSAVAAVAAALAAPAVAADKRDIIVAEPLHNTGYLPLYVAKHKGFFDDEGFSVRIMTIDSGSGHTNAVLSKQAFAFIGGPEHDAFAKAKGAELRAVVNVVDRGNIYLVAKTGLMPKDGNYHDFVKGKTIASGFYGGTPNSVTRYVIDKWGLNPKADVTVSELTTPGILAAMKTGAAQIAVVSEPMLTQGIREGLWGEPFYSVPKELGPYVYSAMNVSEDSIKTDPKMVTAFVRAIVRGLKFTHDNPAEAAEVAHEEFPTMSPDDIKATLDRSFKDGLWSTDGSMTRAGWDTAKAVVMDAGILKQDVPYDAIIDMSFVETLKKASLN